MNIVLLIGRLTQDVELKEVANERTVARICVAVRRDFKNSDGQYDTDFIPVTLWEGLAQTCNQYCHKGSLVSIKGRIQINKRELEDGKTIYQTELIGEKLCMLSSSNKELAEG